MNKASVAQLVEHITRNDGVTGSIPVAGLFLTSLVIRVIHPLRAFSFLRVYISKNYFMIFLDLTQPNAKPNNMIDAGSGTTTDPSAKPVAA